jgi:hypothetical protein
MDVGALVSTIGDEIFFARLSNFLQQRALCDSIAVISYHQDYAPRVIYEALDRVDKEALYDQYFNGAYLFSPFYLSWRAAADKNALHRLRNIAPEGFLTVFFTPAITRVPDCGMKWVSSFQQTRKVRCWFHWVEPQD